MVRVPLRSIHFLSQKLWHGYLDCFPELNVLWFPSSACTLIPRPFHGPDCFTVSNICTYTYLHSRWYVGAWRRPCLLSLNTRYQLWSGPYWIIIITICGAILWIHARVIDYNQNKAASSAEIAAATRPFNAPLVSSTPLGDFSTLRWNQSPEYFTFTKLGLKFSIRRYFTSNKSRH